MAEEEVIEETPVEEVVETPVEEAPAEEVEAAPEPVVAAADGPMDGDGLNYMVTGMDGTQNVCVRERGRFESGDKMYLDSEVDSYAAL